MSTKGWVTVVPGKGQIGEVARALLALADSPADVRTDGNGSEFLIPPYLADLYNQPAPDTIPFSEPAPKTRRRLKKQEAD